MKEQSENDRRSFWFDRLINNEIQIPEESKINLIKTALTHFCGLSEQELIAFTLPDEALTPSDMNNVLQYSSAETKIDLSFNGGATEGIFSNDKKMAKEARKNIKQAIKKELLDVPDANEMIDLMGPYDGAIIVQMIVGTAHPLWRRIRNAYLPGMTDLIVRTYDSQGKLVSSEDKTHLLFDGSKDAVSQIEQLISGTPSNE